MVLVSCPALRELADGEVAVKATLKLCDLDMLNAH